MTDITVTFEAVGAGIAPRVVSIHPRNDVGAAEALRRAQSALAASVARHGAGSGARVTITSGETAYVLTPGAAMDSDGQYWPEHLGLRAADF